MSVFKNNTLKYQRLTLLFIVLILAGSVIGIVVPAGLGWDFANFYDAGRRVAAGQVSDLYDADTLIRGQEPQGKLAFWGTPLSAILYVPMSWFPPETALILFKIQNTLAYFIAFLVLFLFNLKFVDNSPTEQWKFAALFAFLCLIYQPFWTVYRVGGQTTPTVVMLLTLALISHANLRFSLSSLFFVMAVLIKPIFATGLVFLMCVSGLRFLGSTIAFLCVSGLASLLMMGWGIHAAFLSKVLGGVKATYPWFYNSSLYILIEHLRLLSTHGSGPHLPDGVFTVGIVAIKAIVIGLFVVIMVNSRKETWSDAARSHFNFLMAVCFGLLISQTVWEHYLSVLFLPLAYFAACYKEFSRRAKVVLGSIVVVAIGQNLIFINSTNKFPYLAFDFRVATNKFTSDEL